MTIADLQIVNGGASVPPSLEPSPLPRTITDGVLAHVEGGHAEAP
jgi:hypothetical protein